MRKFILILLLLLAGTTQAGYWTGAGSCSSQQFGTGQASADCYCATTNLIYAKEKSLHTSSPPQSTPTLFRYFCANADTNWTSISSYKYSSYVCDDNNYYGDGYTCPEDVVTCNDFSIVKRVTDGTAPNICVEDCSFDLIGMGIRDWASGTLEGTFKSNGSSCTGTSQDNEPPPPNANEPENCRLVNGVLYCGSDVPGEVCATATASLTEICIAGQGCGTINGELVCPTDGQNCVMVNGSPLCIQPEAGPTEPQHSEPDVCFDNGTGGIVCVDNTKKEFEQKDTVTNPDGSTTTTTNKTTNVKGDEGKTTTTTTDTDGNTTTETSGQDESMPSVPAFDDYGGIEALAEGMGTDVPTDPGFASPLNITTGSCQSLDMTIAGETITIPGVHCPKVEWLKAVLGWALYVATALYLFHIATTKEA